NGIVFAFEIICTNIRIKEVHYSGSLGISYFASILSGSTNASSFIRPFWFNTPPFAAAQEMHRFHKKLVVELPCTACSVCHRHTEQRQAATRLVYTNEPPLK
ncbi:MAG: hypothetical protein LBF83_07540, partial [Spirochaetaceae bacterium]|nr:hypothetical protein [Spirochaetaceae bacterium]